MSILGDVSLEQVAMKVLEAENWMAPFLVADCNNDGSVDVTDYIVTLSVKAKAKGKNVIMLMEGRYWIRPDRFKTLSYMTYLGLGDARFITKETVPYNVMLATTPTSKCTRFKNLGFDQTGDASMVPEPTKGIHILHIPDSDDIEVDDCRFYGNGVTSLLIQPNPGWGNKVKITNNKTFWNRKVDQYFDSTMFYIEGFSGEVAGNEFHITNEHGVVDWRTESGMEIHSPNMSVHDNTIDGCINGILHTQNPSLYPSYDNKILGKVRIKDNNVFKCVRGIVCWGSHLQTGVITKNVDISGNYVNPHMEAGSQFNFYYPMIGIGFVDGRGPGGAVGDDSFIREMAIHGNQIETTYQEGLDLSSLLNYTLQEKELGGISLRTNNSCEDIDIYENIINYPFAAIKLCAQQDRIANLHKRIRVFNNRFLDCSIYHAYDPEDQKFDAIYNTKNVDDVDIFKNRVYGKQPSYAPIEYLRKGINSSNVKYEEG